jgi:hypothetical protein
LTGAQSDTTRAKNFSTLENHTFEIICFRLSFESFTTLIAVTDEKLSVRLNLLHTSILKRLYEIEEPAGPQLLERSFACAECLSGFK